MTEFNGIDTWGRGHSVCQTLSSRNTRQGTNYILGTEIVLRQTGHERKLIKPKKQVLKRQITKLGSTGEKSCPHGEIKIDQKT